MTITEERRAGGLQRVCILKPANRAREEGSPITGLESLNKDTKVLTVKGSTSAQNIREAPDAVILEFENYQDAFTALKAGQGRCPDHRQFHPPRHAWGPEL